MSYLTVESPGGPPGSFRDSGLTGARGRLGLTPGRVVALVFGVPVFLALIGWSAFTVVAMLDVESYPVNVTIPVVNHKVTAQIDGNLTVRQAAVSRAQLTGIAKYSLFRDVVTTRQTAAGTLVRYRCDIGVGECSLDGTLVVPSQVSLVSLNTAGGDVSMANYQGNLALDLAGGNLNAGTLTGSVTINSSGGDVSVNSLNARVQMDTSGGNVNIAAVTSNGGVLRSDGGDVTLTFTQIPNDLTIYSNGGNVELSLPPSHYDYHVTTNGGNESNLPDSDPSSSNKITVQSNGGDVTINAGS